MGLAERALSWSLPRGKAVSTCPVCRRERFDGGGLPPRCWRESPQGDRHCYRLGYEREKEWRERAEELLHEVKGYIKPLIAHGNDMTDRVDKLEKLLRSARLEIDVVRPVDLIDEIDAALSEKREKP